MTKVLVVDDDPMVRTGLSMILGGAPDLELVGEATNGQEAIDGVRRFSPDVVLMDIRMPVRDGLSAATEILAAAVRPRVIMLTTFDADEMVHRALRAGADGFLLKDTPPERIVESIRAVSRGEPTLSPTVTARLIAAVTEAPDPGGSAARATARRRLEALTAREREVALAIGGGASNADIAGTLFMSVATVKSHVTSILAKTGAESRLQVAVLVRDAEL
ncbi:MAG TPA: response regulator transcription factor [Phycicoccus elongatus]|jgi:DNA-binding NarL/FixJ family response regulator|uniref:Two component transcriptional regulator, LuxR family n=1 Tax=Phycicoccus elongatus Lp2 TaxID=1193181 RepID=N0DYC9_9MICO|nr:MULTISPECIES: response regulator transcription factor [Phycicoccus]MCB1240604.1 response regulator transcription factor [Tetrasphaera sp.]MCB9407628.1 response regulator transcription factor [Tetrasphaera sp.]MCO5303264.1 response regulator transcription factor [Phycicoccus sp.]CCH69423.1 Two component transcriptional regulator, LuxR family [Phycicoccus elongatus Lp2]HOA66796.1 response regulator transcription factor [Phycicoccus elongatus]